MAYADIINNLIALAEQTLTEAGYSNYTVSHTFIDDARGTDDLPYMYVYSGDATLSRANATMLHIARNFYLELYHTRETRDDMINRNHDIMVKELIENLIINIVRSGHNLKVNGRGTNHVVNVSLPRDVSVGRASINRDTYIGSRIDVTITYQISV